MPRAARNNSHGGWVNKLWFALECRDQRSVSLLLRQGANVNHVFKESGHGRHGLSPIFIAIGKNCPEVVRVLLSGGCNLEQPDHNGETPFFHALRKSKLKILKQIVDADCNVNHVNNHGENAIFLAIRWGRKDLLDYLIPLGIDIDSVNREGNTPVLLALEFYENSHSSFVTRRSAPSNISEIIATIVPYSSCLNHQHPNKGSALRIALNIEAKHSTNDLKLTTLLLQHGAVPDRLFFLRYGGLLASNAKPGYAEFFTPKFFSLAIASGAVLQRERTWLQTVLHEMPEELNPHQQLFVELFTKCVSPLSLQTVCILKIRQILGGTLWKKIEKLPLPTAVKDSLKLIL